MYTLFTWYAWGFGRWIKRVESNNISELLRVVSGHPTMTYKIVKDAKVVKFHCGVGYRLGMVMPRKQID